MISHLSNLVKEDSKELEERKLEGKASTNHANQEMRKMPESDKFIGHLSNLVKEDSKELVEKELMEAEVSSYPDKSEVTKFEENQI